MTDLIHGLRAISASLNDRAEKNRIAMRDDLSRICAEIGGAFGDAADSLEHRWRQRNEAILVQTCSRCVETGIPHDATTCPACGSPLPGKVKKGRAHADA